MSRNDDKEKQREKDCKKKAWFRATAANTITGGVNPDQPPINVMEEMQKCAKPAKNDEPTPAPSSASSGGSCFGFFNKKSNADKVANQVSDGHGY